MLSERVGHDIGTFSKSLDFRNIDTWVIRAVCEQIQEYITPGNVRLPISKNDNLLKDLEIDKEDLYEDLLVEIAQRTKRSLDDIDKNSCFHELSTVEDLVYLFNTQPIENIYNA